ncbi:PECT1 [Symbiodinium sp. CCMP2592]|nr:PECT1 [Symbiodinium sp. CCMP2592]
MLDVDIPAKYKQQELDLRKKYAEELAAWKTSEAFQAFAMEVDEWSKTEEAQNTKKPRKSFKTWKLKKIQSKRAADKLADRERKKAEMAAARERAKFEKAAGKRKGKVAKAGAPAEPEPPLVEIPPPLEKDPFWDECFSGAEAFLDSLDIDVIVGDRIAWAAAQKGGAAGMDLLRKLQRLPFKASSFFRRRSADCPETPLHHALLHKDMEMIQLFAKEMCRSNNATYIVQSIVNGVMHFDLAVGTEIWYWPRHDPGRGGLIPRTGPSEQDALVPHGKDTGVGLKSGDAVFVRELRGMWIRSDRGWFPLMAGNNVQFTKEDPQLTRTRRRFIGSCFAPASPKTSSQPSVRLQERVQGEPICRPNPGLRGQANVHVLDLVRVRSRDAFGKQVFRVFREIKAELTASEPARYQLLRLLKHLDSATQHGHVL